MAQQIRNKLIQLLLKNKSQFISGEEISQQLGCSRAAIWKHIQELKSEGYKIEARTKNGYRLLYQPDRVAPEEVQVHLQTNQFGRSIRYSFSTESTQKIAHQWAKANAPNGALVVAEEQTAGKGRLGNYWVSPPRTGIWMSLILRPSIHISQASHFTLLASLGVAQALQKTTQLPVQIKWPNDLLIHGKKISGILTELRGEPDQIDYLILGIGINVNASPQHWEKTIQEKATSIYIEKGNRIARAPLIAAVLWYLEKLYIQYFEQGFSPIQQQWEKMTYLFGRTIKARTPQGTVIGVAEKLNEQGALVLRTHTGLQTIYSAEID